MSLYNINQLSDDALDKALYHYSIKLQGKLDELKSKTISRYKDLIRIADINSYVYVDESKLSLCFNESPKDSYLDTLMSDAENAIYDYIFRWTPNINPDIINLLNCNQESTLRFNLERVANAIYAEYDQTVTFYKLPNTIRYLLKSYIGDNAVFTKSGDLSKEFIAHTVTEVKKNKLHCRIHPLALYTNHMHYLKNEINNAVGEFLDMIFHTSFVPPFYFSYNEEIDPPTNIEELINVIDKLNITGQSRYPTYMKDIIKFVKTSDDFSKSFNKIMNERDNVTLQCSDLFDIICNHMYVINKVDLDLNPTDETLYDFMKGKSLAWDVFGNLIKL